VSTKDSPLTYHRGGLAGDALSKLGRVCAVSSMVTRSGIVVLVAWWWLKDYDLGAHDEEGS
jgi:hypothetical protein